MATPKQRAKAIVDALLNGDTPAAKIDKIVDSVVESRHSEPVASMSDGQKAKVFLDLVLSQFKDAIVLKRERDAARTVQGSARADTDTEFTPTPDP